MKIKLFRGDTLFELEKEINTYMAKNNVSEGDVVSSQLSDSNHLVTISLIHNEPDGSDEPSHADIKLLREQLAQQALQINQQSSFLGENKNILDKQADLITQARAIFEAALAGDPWWKEARTWLRELESPGIGIT